MFPKSYRLQRENRELKGKALTKATSLLISRVPPLSKMLPPKTYEASQKRQHTYHDRKHEVLRKIMHLDMTLASFEWNPAESEIRRNNAGIMAVYPCRPTWIERLGSHQNCAA